MKFTIEEKLRAAQINELEILAALAKQRDVAHRLLMSPRAPRAFMERAAALAEDLQELADGLTRDVRRLSGQAKRGGR